MTMPMLADTDRPEVSGLYRMGAEAYHADPAPAPSLSNSIARLMLDKSALHAWTAHPRLNPDWQPEGADKALDFGTAAHTLLLGKGRYLVVVDAANWTTKAAKAARDQAIADGATPILTGELERAETMIAAARAQLEHIPGCEALFGEAGESELAAVWQEGETWCRSLIDWIALGDGEIVVADYKTTSASAAPAPGARRLYDLGYHMQEAFITRGLRAVLGAGRPIRFVIVMQEKEPPHLLSVFETDAAGRLIGEKMFAAATALWRRCLAEGVWPGYPARVVTAELPPWTEANWTEREVHDAALADEGRTMFDIASRWAPEPKEKPLTEPC